jgi:hypothetical protein
VAQGSAVTAGFLRPKTKRDWVFFENPIGEILYLMPTRLSLRKAFSEVGQGQFADFPRSMMSRSSMGPPLLFFRFFIGFFGIIE